MTYEIIFIENTPFTTNVRFKNWLNVATVQSNGSSSENRLTMTLSYNCIRAFKFACDIDNLKELLIAVNNIKVALTRMIGIMDLGPMECVNNDVNLYVSIKRQYNKIYMAESSRGILLVKPCNKEYIIRQGHTMLSNISTKVKKDSRYLVY